MSFDVVLTALARPVPVLPAPGGARAASGSAWWGGGAVRDRAGEAQAAARDPGPSEAEASLRLAAWWPNAVPSAPPAPLWRRVLLQLRVPLIVVLVLLAAALLTVATGDVSDTVVIAFHRGGEQGGRCVSGGAGGACCRRAVRPQRPGGESAAGRPGAFGGRRRGRRG
nr:cation-transporting P-type ATPase [Streptomyces sp. RKND-216]